MTRYVALLRGIAPMVPNMQNVKLRGVFEALGFEGVRSVISSGNVLFESRARNVPRLEARIEAAWPEQLGFTSTTIVRSRAEIDGMIAANPFGDRPNTPSSSLQVTFLQREPDPPLQPFTSERGDYEIIEVRDRAIYSVIDETGKPPDILRVLERRLGTAMTTRTWKTVHRIARALEADPTVS
jgi:uncharacterized protein (DUF1697 family)